MGIGLHSSISSSNSSSSNGTTRLALLAPMLLLPRPEGWKRTGLPFLGDELRWSEHFCGIWYTASSTQHRRSVTGVYGNMGMGTGIIN